MGGCCVDAPTIIPCNYHHLRLSVDNRCSKKSSNSAPSLHEQNSRQNLVAAVFMRAAWDPETQGRIGQLIVSDDVELDYSQFVRSAGDAEVRKSF